MSQNFPNQIYLILVNAKNRGQGRKRLRAGHVVSVLPLTSVLKEGQKFKSAINGLPVNSSRHTFVVMGTNNAPPRKNVHWKSAGIGPYNILMPSEAAELFGSYDDNPIVHNRAESCWVSLYAKQNIANASGKGKPQHFKSTVIVSHRLDDILSGDGRFGAEYNDPEKYGIITYTRAAPISNSKKIYGEGAFYTKHVARKTLPSLFEEAKPETVASPTALPARTSQQPAALVEAPDPAAEKGGDGQNGKATDTGAFKFEMKTFDRPQA